MCETNPTRFEIAQGLATTITRMILDVIPEGYAAAAVDESIIKAKDSLIDPIMLAMKAVEVIEIDNLLGTIAGWSMADSGRARESAKNGVYFDAAEKSAICDGYQRVALLIQTQFEEAYSAIEAAAISKVNEKQNP